MTGRRVEFGRQPDDDNAYDTAVLADICLQVACEIEVLVLQYNTWVFTEDKIDETLMIMYVNTRKKRMEWKNKPLSLTLGTGCPFPNSQSCGTRNSSESDSDQQRSIVGPTTPDDAG